MRGFASLGAITFLAKDSFETSLGSATGGLFGGGGQVLLPWGLYAEVSAARFRRSGQRVFVGPGNEVFELGIPLSVTVTPIEVTAGWRYQKTARRPPLRRLSSGWPIVPYLGAGFSSFAYRETSEFGDAADEVSDRFTGFHVAGGVEYRVWRWIGVAGEVRWATIADALAGGGVSKAFGEDNLGGTSVRVKIAVGK